MNQCLNKSNERVVTNPMNKCLEINFADFHRCSTSGSIFHCVLLKTTISVYCGKPHPQHCLTTVRWYCRSSTARVDAMIRLELQRDLCAMKEQDFAWGQVLKRLHENTVFGSTSRNADSESPESVSLDTSSKMARYPRTRGSSPRQDIPGSEVQVFLGMITYVLRRLPGGHFKACQRSQNRSRRLITSQHLICNHRLHLRPNYGLDISGPYYNDLSIVALVDYYSKSPEVLIARKHDLRRRHHLVGRNLRTLWTA